MIVNSRTKTGKVIKPIRKTVGGFNFLWKSGNQYLLYTLSCIQSKCRTLRALTVKSNKLFNNMIHDAFNDKSLVITTEIHNSPFLLFHYATDTDVTSTKHPHLFSRNKIQWTRQEDAAKMSRPCYLYWYYVLQYMHVNVNLHKHQRRSDKNENKEMSVCLVAVGLFGNNGCIGVGVAKDHTYGS